MRFNPLIEARLGFVPRTGGKLKAPPSFDCEVGSRPACSESDERLQQRVDLETGVCRLGNRGKPPRDLASLSGILVFSSWLIVSPSSLTEGISDPDGNSRTKLRQGVGSE